MFVTTGTTVSQNSWLFKDINYDPMTDFVGIAVLGGFPLSIVVPPQSPYRDFKELMQAIHTSTQGITYATAYGMQTVCGELLGKAAKGKVLGIPYKSTPPA
ncbi:tripartite tricarboxylate transporter substrate-binding protein, partial [Salmonella enterica subsp. enterica]